MEKHSDHSHKTCNSSRRRFVQGTLAAGLSLTLPGKVFAGNIQELDGAVFVNGKRAQSNTTIQAGDRVTTAYNSSITFTIGADAFLLKGASSIEIDRDESLLVSGLKLLTGGLLAVFGPSKKPRHLVSPTVTIGIRGTGLFLQQDTKSSYYCTCYGSTSINSSHQQRQLTTTHHGSINISNSGEITDNGKLLHHDDDELRLLESLVGRTPPFDQ